MKRMNMIQPFLKVPLQRRGITDSVASFFPSFVHDSSFNYIDPFLGNGENLFRIINTTSVDESYCIDGNAALINTYDMVRDCPDDLISLLGHMKNSYSVLDDAGRRIYYQYFRTVFNNGGSSDVEMAAQYIFLNHTAYKGMYRENRSGKFNVPFGNPKYPSICDEDAIRRASAALQKCILIKSCYDDISSLISGRCFAYFEIPLGYGREDHVRFRKFLDTISDRCSFLCLGKDADSGFMDGIYVGYQTSSIGGSWNIIRN